MLHAKFQDHRTSGSGEDFKGFYHIWAWRPSWSCDLDHLLAHLSRRLIGELIVYKDIRRPSVRPSSVRRPSVNIFKRHLL